MPIPAFTIVDEELKQEVVDNKLKPLEFKFSIESTKSCVDKGLEMDIVMTLSEEEKIH